MPRLRRADEAGGLYHALNRGNLRADIFKKEATLRRLRKSFTRGSIASKSSCLVTN